MKFGLFFGTLLLSLHPNISLIIHPVLNAFIKQDCEYLGEPLLNTDNIADAKHCQEFCGLYAELGCQYWVFQKKGDKHDCLLLKGGERNCGTTGGPKSPSISDCSMGNIFL